MDLVVPAIERIETFAEDARRPRKNPDLLEVELAGVTLNAYVLSTREALRALLDEVSSRPSRWGCRSIYNHLSLAPRDPVAVLGYIEIAHGLRNYGFGRRVMVSFEIWARSRGAEGVLLHAAGFAGNPWRFYEKLDYVVLAWGNGALMWKSFRWPVEASERLVG